MSARLCTLRPKDLFLNFGSLRDLIAQDWLNKILVENSTYDRFMW